MVQVSGVVVPGLVELGFGLGFEAMLPEVATKGVIAARLGSMGQLLAG